MDYYFDLFAKYHDEQEERVIARMLTHAELMALTNHLLYERKRVIETNQTRHYVDYVRIE